MSRRLTRIAAGLAMLAGLLSAIVPAQARDTVYYYSIDPLHSVVVVTDQNRNVVERTYYAPYGQVLNRSTREGPGYTGHAEDPGTGLVYMQQRYYDPVAGRFLSADPVQANPSTGGNFNRYWYAKDNPYRYTDPDGRWADTDFSAGQATRSYAADVMAHPNRPLTPVDKAILAIGGAAVAVAGGAEVGVASAVRAAVGYVGAKIAAKGETELVQRAMSRAELKATQETGLVRGGRPGTHYASDSVNSSAGRAQQRLALPNKPEVKVTMEVPKGKFSSPTRVEPNNNMPGGGKERTATGKIPATVKRIDELKQ